MNKAIDVHQKAERDPTDQAQLAELGADWAGPPGAASLA